MANNASDPFRYLPFNIEKNWTEIVETFILSEQKLFESENKFFLEN